MNSAALLFIVIGVSLIVIGFRYKADNLIAAIMGHTYGNSTLPEALSPGTKGLLSGGIVGKQPPKVAGKPGGTWLDTIKSNTGA